MVLSVRVYIVHVLWERSAYSNKGSKNISIKMLKDVGMTVPKSRETSVVYIYAAIQGMRDYIYMQQDRG